MEDVVSVEVREGEAHLFDVSNALNLCMPRVIIIRQTAQQVWTGKSVVVVVKDDGGNGGDGGMVGMVGWWGWWDGGEGGKGGDGEIVRLF